MLSGGVATELSVPTTAAVALPSGSPCGAPWEAPWDPPSSGAACTEEKRTAKAAQVTRIEKRIMLNNFLATSGI